MNNDIPITASILLGLLAIPFAASSITIGDDDTFFSLFPITNTPSYYESTIGDNEIKIEQQTPYGKFSITVTHEKIEQVLIKPNRKVEVIQTPDNIYWKITVPTELLIINQTPLRIIEKYETPYGRINVIKENGGTKTIKSGNVSLSKMQEMENDLNYYVNLMKNLSYEILGIEGNSVNVIITFINATDEFVEIKNNGTETVNMKGWKLLDEAFHTYTFPELYLYPNSTVRIHSGSGGSGTDNSTDLFWTTSNIWNNDHDTAILKDPYGSVIDIYEY